MYIYTLYIIYFLLLYCNILSFMLHTLHIITRYRSLLLYKKLLKKYSEVQTPDCGCIHPGKYKFELKI